MTMALVALSIVGIIAMAALSIDVGTLYQGSTEAQRSADAAALAAARVLSLNGVTGDPTNASNQWSTVCTAATQMAQTVGAQDTVGGAAPSVSVTFLSTDGTGCSGAAFGVNPMVTVQVTQSSLPTYFSRIWGRTGNTVSATATAEAFNPSGTSPMVPVSPRCVKPWMVPNYEPWTLSNTCNTTNCTAFVNETTGAIQSGGVLPNPANTVIGQTFWLLPDCVHNTQACNPLRDNSPRANINRSAYYPPLPNLEYLPGQTLYDSVAVPSDETDACAASAAPDKYAEAIAGCDQSTIYQCGVQKGINYVDLSENPALGDTTNGAQCLIHQGAAASDIVTSLGQDMLQPSPTAPPTPNYPFQIQAGTSNPLTAQRGTLVTSSTSIVSLPIYDSTAAPTFATVGTGTANVTIIGFLQVFINYVDGNGNMNVTVMNVAGCGNAVSSATTPVYGTSPVPIRLITPPTPGP